VFLSDDFRDKLVAAGNDIIETILQPDFKQLTERAIPDKWRVANENDHSHFIALDFGICKDENGNIVPKLIEMQGFPSLYGFQVQIGDQYQSTFNIPEEWTIYFSGLEKESYLQLLKKTVIGPYKPEEVVLMDVKAHEQKTNIDFYLTRQYIGIAVVALDELIQKGNKLYYLLNGKEQQIKRIYNRLIFDEIENDPEIFTKIADIRQPLDVEWITHPNWFYRISKFTMPFLKGEYVPETKFLHQVNPIPDNLEDYVLKPLFSFAGQGVIIDVTQKDIENIKDPENWILQRKVKYEPVVQSGDGGVKVEIRLLYLWPDGDAKPTLSINLARLSRGKMIGVRYNKDFNWVGGTIAFIRK
jgi:glutathionylspermidine synthase